MAKSWLLVTAGLLACSATPGCEDNPDQIYKPADKGFGNVGNDGESVPAIDPWVRNSFRDNFNATSKQELCSGPVKQQKWAAMVSRPIVPLKDIGGLDLRGGDAWTGLDFRDAEQQLCQSKAVSGSETDLTAEWGDAGEVRVVYKLSNNTISDFQLRPGFRGRLEFNSRKGGAYGDHKYVIEVGQPIKRDGQNYNLNWNKPCASATDMTCWDKQSTELYDGIIATFEPGFASTESCIKQQSCLARVFPDGGAAFGVRPLGMYFAVPSVKQQQPAPSTPGYLYGFYVKLMPFSAPELFLKLDKEGPIASSFKLGDLQKDCRQRLGMSYGEFLDSCVNINKDPKQNELSNGKLTGGMSHSTEAFDFSLEGVNLDFLAKGLGEFDTVGDKDAPTKNAESFEFNMDIRATGKVRNEYAANATELTDDKFTFGGTGAIYREYARRVHEDIKRHMKEWSGSVRNKNGEGKCDGGWVEEADKKCHYQGFEIGDDACLDGPAPGCTGFESFLTPASRFYGKTEGVRKMSVGALGQNLGLVTALKAGDPRALFCSDPSPNPSGKNKGEACSDNNECWSTACSAECVFTVPKPADLELCPAPWGTSGTNCVLKKFAAKSDSDPNAWVCKTRHPVTNVELSIPAETQKKCEDPLAKYYRGCEAEDGGIVEGSFKRVIKILGQDQANNLPPAVRDKKYFFRIWAESMVKYLKAAPLFPVDLDASVCGGSVDEVCVVENTEAPGSTLTRTMCDANTSCEPEPEHLIFDQVAQYQDNNTFEYIDRRFVRLENGEEIEPLKIEYQILVNSGNQQEWRFHRKMTRGERALYRAMQIDRTQPVGGHEDNLRMTNLVGSPVLAGGGWVGVPKGGTTGTKDAHYCASTLFDPAMGQVNTTDKRKNTVPDPECKDAGNPKPPFDSKTGQYMRDGFGDPILTRYKGAFTGTAFAMGASYLKLLEPLPFIKSAKVNVPQFENPYAPPDPEDDASIAAVKAPTVLLEWRPKTPANGIRIPVNAQRDKFTPSYTALMSGSSLEFELSYELVPGSKYMKVQGVKSGNFMGYIFLCMDPNNRDFLAVEPYESWKEIQAWGQEHPGAFEACQIDYHPSATNEELPLFLYSKAAGVVINMGLGSGDPRLMSVELFDTSLL